MDIQHIELFYLTGLPAESLNNDLTFSRLPRFISKPDIPIREAERMCITFASLST